MRPMRVAGWDVTAHLDLLKHLVFFLLHLGLDLFNFFSTNFPSRKALNFDSTIFQFEISTVIEFFELMGKFLYLLNLPEQCLHVIEPLDPHLRKMINS
mmetsp:Transcript_49676/g.130670  ORF Transcript_49676/g.130670 Transcript_49676/m.130670 type:complete len:98 (+) Transcript_49676:325-618(+)